MKHFYILLAALLIGNYSFGQTTVTYDFSVVGASTADNIDTNISFTTAANNSTPAPNIVSGQLQLQEDPVKGGSIIITPLNGVTITSVVINASIKTNDAGYTVDGGTETELSWVNPSYIISGITALTEVEFYQKQNGNNKEIYVNNIAVTYGSPTPITYTYNGSWSPSDPNGASSAIDAIIVASGNAAISTNTAINTVNVNPGAIMTINTGITLTVTDNVTLESSSANYSSLIYNGNGTIAGTVKYERFVNYNAGGNDLISPPLSGETWANFLASDTNAADLLDNGLTDPTTYAFGPFDKTSDDYVNYTSATSATLTSGTGYRAATDPAIGTGTTLTFTGTVPTTAVAVNITDIGALHPDWNLIGNPYPAYIGMADFLNYLTGTGVKNIDILEDLSGIYGYDGSASWDVVTLANAGTRLITPGQGFLVAANADFVGSHDITFDTSMISTTGSGDDFIVGRNANVSTFLKLKASTSSKNYSTQFYFNEASSQGVDHGYDGKLWGSTVPSFALYSHLVQDNAGFPIALQALNPSDLTNVIIPLGVNAVQGEQLTFSISEMTLPAKTDVYLEDMVANTSTLLNHTDYIITPNANITGTGRFYLRVTDNALSTTEYPLDNLNIFTNNIDKTIVVTGQLLKSTIANIYDLHGRMVNTTDLNTSKNSQSIDASHLSSGVYIVQLSNATQNISQKVIIK